MTLKVIGAGFGRTGTMSLQAALEQLGFGNCYHMQEMFKNRHHPKLWEDALLGNGAAWDEIFEGYQSTVDWPGCTFYRELMELYPEAKVVLNVRDAERWYDSTFESIYRVPNSLFMHLVKVLVPHMRTAYRVVDLVVWSGTFEGRFAEREHAIDIFNRHNAAVQATVDPDRLLVYNVKEGWEPLCKFLGVPVPKETPFPHLNDKVILQRVLRWGPVVIFALLGVIVGILLWLGRLVRSVVIGSCKSQNV